MKRLITFICLFVIIFVGYTLITKGFESNSFNIPNYEVIEDKSEALTKKLAVYDKKNQEEYETAVTNLNSSIKSFKGSKEKYEAIREELADVLNKDDTESVDEVIEEVIYSDKEKYMMDFLLVTLGNYGEKEGVDVDLKLTTSSTTDSNASTLNYFLADLKFTVTGQYIDVTNFISDLENNDKLNWEIKDFSMANGTANGYTGVSATFTIKDVPIDSESYIETSSYTGYSTNDGATPDASVDTQTNPTTDSSVATNTVSNVDGNTVSNTVTTTTSNTVVNNTLN